MTPHPDTCDICGCQLLPAYENMYDDRYGHPQLFFVMKCNGCGTLATMPPLSAAEVGPLYTNYYPRHVINLATVERRGNAPETPWQRLVYWWNGNHKIQHMLPLVGNRKRILDVGCGDGASLIELNRHGYEAYGIEADENIALVRDSFKLPIHIGFIENCPFPERSFDIIIANQVIEHIIDLDSFMANIKRFLAPGGIVILSTPNGNSIYRKLFGRKWAHWHIPYHQHILNKKALAILLARHDLSITSSRTVSPTTWMIHTLNRLRHTPVRGAKNPLWQYDQRDQARQGNTASTRPGRKAIVAGKRILYHLVLNAISLCNRMVDVFRNGDCIVIFARQK